MIIPKNILTDETEDFSIEIEPQDIEFERERATIECSDGYLELLAIHRKISEIMPKYNTILFHGLYLLLMGKHIFLQLLVGLEINTY